MEVRRSRRVAGVALIVGLWLGVFGFLVQVRNGSGCTGEVFIALGALSGAALAWLFTRLGVFERSRKLRWFVLLGVTLGAIAYGYDAVSCLR